METDIKDVKKYLQISYKSKFSTTKLIPDNVVGMPTDSFVMPGDFFALALDATKSPLLGPKYVPIDVNLLGDVFAQPNYLQSKFVSLSGDGGIGKTTQISKLLLDWSNSLEQLDHFDLVIYISTGCLRPFDESLLSLLCGENRLFPQIFASKVQKVLDSYKASERVMFILDDFWHFQQNFLWDILTGNSFSNATVLVSGRPTAIKTHLQGTRQLDVTLDLLGIPERHVEALLLKLLDNDELKLQHLKQVCQDHLYDLTLLRRPFFAVLFCCAFHAVNEMKLEICQKTAPVTTTELFHVMLRASLKVYLGRKYPTTNFNVAFNRSPLLDEDCLLPGETKRLLYHLGKMSFQALQRGQTCFSEEDLRLAFVDLEEVCGIGLFKFFCDTGTEDQKTEKIYEFCHRMFQEYFAALYISVEHAEFMNVIQTKFTRNTIARRDDDGYETASSNGDFSGPVKTNFKSPFQCMARKKKKHPVENNDPSFETSSLCSKRPPQENCTEPVESSCKEFFYEVDETRLTSCSLKACPEFPSARHLNTFEKRTEQSNADAHTAVAQSNDSWDDDEETLCKAVSVKSVLSQEYCSSLVETVHPFELVVLFASGMSPKFTGKLLQVTGGKVALKVCLWNPNKYDIGYEALLFCEVYDEQVKSGFFRYLLSLTEKRSSVIQFPTAFDEIATVRMVGSFSLEQAQHLLHYWYDFDLLGNQYSGANITSSTSSFIELYDPCLVEVLLLHKFQHPHIEQIKVVGNYFSDFDHLFASFPNAKDVTLENTNIASMQPSGSAQFGLDSLIGYASFVNPKGQKLTSFHISGVHLSCQVWEQLKRVFSNSLKTMQLLTVDNLSLSDEQLAEEIFLIIQKCKVLEALKFTRIGLNSVGPEAVQQKIWHTLTFHRLLMDMNYLTELDMSKNRLGMALSAVLQCLKVDGSKLKRLVLKESHISNSCFSLIAPILVDLAALEYLDLSHNPIGDDVHVLLEKLSLSKTSGLTSLKMAYCGITVKGFLSMSKFLPKVALGSIDISGNALSSAAKEFVKCLHASITELVASDCFLQPQHALDIALGLRNVPLRQLSLSNNVIGKSVEDLTKALRHKNSIVVLNLANCHLSPRDMKKCSANVASLKRLEELHIGKNTCCDATSDYRNEIVKTFVKCKSLTKIVVPVMFGRNFRMSHVQVLRQYIPSVICFKVSNN